MKEEGRMRSHYFIDGKWQDAVVLGCWPTRPAPSPSPA
jgi:hypothetical protein